MEEKLIQYANLIKLCNLLADMDAEKYIKAKPRKVTQEEWKHELYTHHILNFVEFNRIEMDEETLKMIMAKE